ncbi:hypothetical protein [uncultured Arthrobacter sp.]|uniref:hypothetical protein n=1 Tax=uncultured Arthrobacter sp. TaxID=114050 RepID=UPI0032168A21
MSIGKDFAGGGRTRWVSLLVAVALALLGVAAATGAMRSEKVSNRLCETTGGGRFVKVPGFPGERIDRRLLRDIEWMRERYKIFITDGYSTDPVHAANGEHPLGLALDIVPNKAEGGRWRDITRLAEWAEPEQDRPRAPFRWVGYDGDAGHGRRNHLHLSWSHSPAKFDEPARTVWSVKCPEPRDTDTGDGGDGGSSGGDGGSSGGISTKGSGTSDGGGRGGSSGGISAGRLAPVQPESGGVSAP